MSVPLDSFPLLKTREKTVLAFTSAGKPIFSYCDYQEEDIITLYGVLQAVISISLQSNGVSAELDEDENNDTSDYIRLLQSDDEDITMAFLTHESLYFVIISRTNEPPSVLLTQLGFISKQIIFILTSKIHDMLKKNPGLDVRQVLGTDSKRIFTYLCSGVIQGRKEISYNETSDSDKENEEDTESKEVTNEETIVLESPKKKNNEITTEERNEEATNESIDTDSYSDNESNKDLTTKTSNFLTPIPIAFQSLPTLICEKTIRDLLFQYLKKSIGYCKAACGFIFYNSQLLINCYNTEHFDNLTISTSDILLLSMFIRGSVELTSDSYKSEASGDNGFSGNAPSSSNNDNTKSGGGSPLVQHWVPICLPSVNDKGFLQAYITPLCLNINNNKNESKSTTNSSPGTPIPSSPINNLGKNFNFDNVDVPEGISKELDDPLSSLTMILIAAEADPEMFTNFARSQRFMQKAMNTPEITNFLPMVIRSHSFTANRIRDEFSSLHFFFKLHSISNGTLRSPEASRSSPSQHVFSDPLFPLDVLGHEDQMWTIYEKHAERFRVGSSIPETTLFPPSTSLSYNHPLSIETTPYSPVSTVGDNSVYDFGNNLLSKLPNYDHTVTFTTLDNGVIIVGLAHLECELHVCFPGCISVMDACTKTDLMIRNLRANASTLFSGVSSP